MLATLLILPAFWTFFLWLLPWLEEMTLTSEERAAKINGLLLQETPEEIERQVAKMLETNLRMSRRRSGRRASSHRLALSLGRPPRSRRREFLHLRPSKSSHEAPHQSTTRSSD